jgi:nicotinamidase-related amidase
MLEKLPGRLGIVIVDMQNSFFPGITREKKDSMVVAQLEVLDSAVRNNFPAILIEYTGFSQTLPEITKAFANVPRRSVMAKHYTNGFFATQLHNILDSWDIGCMALMGISAKVCVKETARGAPYGITYLTTETTMADPIMVESRGQHLPSRNHLYLETIDWYQRNGLGCLENHRHLLELMEQK